MTQRAAGRLAIRRAADADGPSLGDVWLRPFFERNGFVPVPFSDGSANEERQPDVLYRWRAAGGVVRAQPPA